MSATGSIGAIKMVAIGLTVLLVGGGGAAVYFGVARVPMAGHMTPGKAGPQSAAVIPEDAGATDAPERGSGRVPEVAPEVVPEVAPEVVIVPGTATPRAPDVPAMALNGDRPTTGFDVVRIERDGAAVVAGRAEPGQRLDVLLDGAPIAAVTADATGQFVGFLDLPEAARPRVLDLRWHDAAGEVRQTGESVILSPSVSAQAPEALAGLARETTAPMPATIPDERAGAIAPEEQVLDASGGVSASAIVPEAPDLVVPPSGTEAGGPLVAQQTQRMPMTVPPTPTATTPAPERAPVAAPEAFLAGADGVQPLAPRALPPPAEIAIDSIAYGSDGAVVVQGRSGSSGSVRLTLNGAEVARVPLLSDPGAWRAELRDVTPGTYRLAVALTGVGGAVLARAETPFLRAAPELTDAADGAGVDVITVQPGFSLWRIARERYGEGLLYVQVFEANRTQIRDPDLIFPGQVLTLPQ